METENKNKVKGYLLAGIVVLVLLISVFQSFQISSIKNQITANAINSDVIDTSSWTEDEKMQYEHHGIMPARFQQNNKQSPNMVGGC
ncbi:hypothetical protein HYX02_02760 [Candidatus Woesearchaeota archaeon]|nr:hypothetical protein [Candidatus Woesearchaeota archaeon]